MKHASSYANLVLRLGLGAVILWFGLNQLLDPEVWTIWIPAWASVFGLSPVVLVYANGAFEVVLSSLLIIGIFTRPIAFILFLHLLVVVFTVGINPIGVRDLGLAAAFLSLALSKKAAAERSP